MLKKWGYILLSAWLINAVICFHPNDSFGGGIAVAPQTPATLFADNTLLDIVAGHIANLTADQGHHRHKFPVKRRYLQNRSQGFNIQLPAAQDFKWLNNVKAIKSTVTFFWENRVFLPPHHNFLFRLSPF